MLDKSNVDGGALDPKLDEPTVAITCEEGVTVVSGPSVTAASARPVAPDVATCPQVVVVNVAAQSAEATDVAARVKHVAVEKLPPAVTATGVAVSESVRPVVAASAPARLSGNPVEVSEGLAAKLKDIISKAAMRGNYSAKPQPEVEPNVDEVGADGASEETESDDLGVSINEIGSIFLAASGVWGFCFFDFINCSVSLC